MKEKHSKTNKDIHNTAAIKMQHKKNRKTMLLLHPGYEIHHSPQLCGHHQIITVWTLET